VKDGICPKCGQASVYEQEMGVTYRSSHGGAFVIFVHPLRLLRELRR